MPAAGLRSSPRRSATSPTARPRRPPTSPASSRRCRRSSQDAVSASNDGLRVADESNALAEAGGAGLKKILAGLGETTAVVVADRPRHRRAAAGVTDGGRAPSPRRPSRPARSPRRRASRRPPRRRIVQATTQMRKIAQEVAKAIAEQGRASRDIIKAAQSATQAVGLGPEGDGRTGQERGRRSPRPSIRCAAARRRRARAVAEQAAATEQIAKAAGVAGEAGGAIVQGTRRAGDGA